MKFRKKPIIIDAEPYHEGLEDGFNYYKITGEFLCYLPKDAKTNPRAGRKPVIETLEGNHEITTNPPDYIVTGIKGERYPVKKDIFEMTYESPDSPKFTDDIIEKLSEEVHNAWMKEKIEQGFHSPNDCEVYNRGIYPEKQNDDEKFKMHCSKCHTDICPYSELPENIKDYARVTVRAVLNAIEKAVLNAIEKLGI